MAYVFHLDTVYTPASGSPGAALVMFNFKELLKTAGWTCVGSGRGGAGAVPGVDFGPLDLVTTALIFNGSVGDKAYVIMQEPGSTKQITIQRIGSDASWRVKLSRSGFAAPAAANVTPSAADEILFYGSGTDAAPGGGQLFPNRGGASDRAQMAASNAAPYTFYMFAHYNGGTTLDAGLFMEAMKPGSYASGDPNPLLNDVEPWIFGMMGNTTDVFTKNGMQGAVNPPSTSAAVAGYLSSTLTAANFRFITAESGASVPGGTGTNPYNSKDDGFDMLWVRNSGNPPPYGRKGIGSMIRWAGPTRSLSSTLTVATARDRYCVGNCTLPWDGSVPNL